MRFGVMLAAVTSILAASSDRPADAYVPSRDARGRPLSWTVPHFRVTFGGSAPVGLSWQAMREAARKAADTWNGVDCATLRIDVDEATSEDRSVTTDGKNLVIVHRVAWCSDETGRSCHAATNPALTNVRFRPRQDGRRAEIHEVDIEINAVDFRWDNPAAPNGADLETVLTHEFGHALGIADACEIPSTSSRRSNARTAPPEARASVMWPLGAPNDIRRRLLTPEDKRAICEMYPKKESR